MHLKEQWIREGFSSYYVVKKEQKLTYEKNILYNHTLPSLLPCEFRIEDGEEYYYYETGIYTKLKDRISMLEPKLFFAYLLEVFEQVASYLLELDHLKLDLESMFLDKENRPVLCYLPEYEKKIDEQLRDFIEECIEYISGDDKKRVRFYYEFHSFLIKEPNMEQMKDYLEVRSEKMNGEILREKIKNEEFYEYDLHHENYYGTSKKLMNEKIDSGKIIVKDIEVNGTENLIKKLGNDTKLVTIFLKVDKEELKNRLINRGDNLSEADMQLRLGRLEYEESKIGLYDYVIKNDNLEKTVQIIMTIIENEKKLEETKIKN